MRYGREAQQFREKRDARAKLRAEGKIETRDQRRGTCQICGRDVAVDDEARTSKHGYTVEQGWGFSGVCIGSDKRAYEIDCQTLRYHVERLHNQQDSMEQRVLALREGRITEVSETIIDYNAPRNRRERVEQRTAADFPRKDKGYYATEETWEQFCEQAAKEVERSVRRLIEHIIMQQNRITSWRLAPEKIRTVKVEK